jgi:serine/threonine-protein kinase RsbW
VETPNDTTKTGSISLHLPAQFRYLAIARDAAMEACRRLRFAEFDCYKVEMAVDEVCTNIIEHSYGGEAPAGQELEHPGFVVEFFSFPDRLVVEVADQGDGFEFDSHRSLNPADYLANNSERGLGMYIIERFVDKVEYERNPQRGNRLRLTKNC